MNKENPAYHNSLGFIPVQISGMVYVASSSYQSKSLARIGFMGSTSHEYGPNKSSSLQAERKTDSPEPVAIVGMSPFSRSYQA